MEMFLIYGTIWVICGLIAGAITSSKGRSFGEGFLYGGLLSIIGIVIAIALPGTAQYKDQKSLMDGTNQKCPHCAEVIKIEATVCRFCGKDLPTLASLAQELQLLASESKFNFPEIKNDELARWRAGFQKVRWFEAIGQNTSTALSFSPEGSMIAQEPLLCVTYSDTNDSHITGAWVNGEVYFSPFTAMIATQGKLALVRPDKQKVKVVEYRNIHEIKTHVERGGVNYSIFMLNGDCLQINVEFIHPEDQKIVNAFFDRVLSNKGFVTD